MAHVADPAILPRDDSFGGASILILGGAGQDGIYLSRLLLSQGFSVSSTCRDQVSEARLKGLVPGVKPIRCDLSNLVALRQLIRVRNDFVIFNLAAVSSVVDSWQRPDEAQLINFEVPRAIMEEIHDIHSSTGREVRLFQASSCEMYGNLASAPQDERSPMRPVSPYGVHKKQAHDLLRKYRAEYNYHFVSGILFNHESPLRPPRFVSRKISIAAARIFLGLQEEIELMNPEVCRDWGHAADYVDAMVRMTLGPEAKDYVVASGVGRSVRDLAVAALTELGVSNAEERIRTSPRVSDRPVVTTNLIGDATLIRADFGWEPRVSFQEMIGQMVAIDLDLQSGLLAP